MFGRRNPDRPLGPQPGAQKTDLDLSILDHLPDIKPAARGDAVVPEHENMADEAALGPSVRQLLREAESTSSAPPQAAVTQQLSAVELEPLAVNAEPWQPDSQSGPMFTEPYELPAFTDQDELPTLSSELGLHEAEQWAAPAPVAQEAPAPVAQETPAPVAQEAPAPAVPALPARGGPESLIGPDDFFDGHYRSERGVRVQGSARGSIESRQYILVEASAQVDADIAAEEIVVAGSFSGKIICHGRLEIMATGKVQGAIETKSLIVHEGGALDGELHMRRGDS